MSYLYVLTAGELPHGAGPVVWGCLGPYGADETGLILSAEARLLNESPPDSTVHRLEREAYVSQADAKYILLNRLLDAKRRGE